MSTPIKLSSKTPFPVVLPGDRIVMIRSATDEVDAAKRVASTSIGALAAAIGTGVTDANDLKGGLYSIQFYSQLAAIPAAKRRVGMEANVWNGATVERGKYTLAGDLTTWVKAGALLTQTAPVYNSATLYNEASGYITFALSGGPRRLFLSANIGGAVLQPAPLSGALPGVVNAAWVEIADGTGNALFRPVTLAEAVNLLDLRTLVPGLLYAIAFPALAAQVAQTVWLQALDPATFQGVGHVYADGTLERTKLVTADVRTGVVTVFSSGGGVTAAELAVVKETVPSRFVSGPEVTLIRADAGGTVCCNNTGANYSVLVPHSSLVPFPLFTTILVLRDCGIKEVTIGPSLAAATVFVENVSNFFRINRNLQFATLYQVALNRWILTGDLRP